MRFHVIPQVCNPLKRFITPGTRMVPHGLVDLPLMPFQLHHRTEHFPTGEALLLYGGMHRLRVQFQGLTELEGRLTLVAF